MNRALRLGVVAICVATLCVSQGVPAGAVSPPRLIPTLNLTIVEYLYSPDPGIPMVVGALADWKNNGTLTHTATQNGPLHLFDTGYITPSSDGFVSLYYAGEFPYHCVIHPTLLKGTLDVPMDTYPTSGGTSTVFNFFWASTALPAGDIFLYQVRRNGGRWNSVLTRAQSTSGTMSRIGMYDVRVREQRKKDPSKHAGWSPISTITVS